MAGKTQMPHDVDISAFALWNLLRAGWKAIVWGVAAGLVAAVAGIVLIPQKYEAVAIIRVGQVGQIGQIGGLYAATSQPIEAPAQALERMTTAQFQRRVAEALNDPGWLQGIERSSWIRPFSLELLKNTLEPNQVPLIQLRVQGASVYAAQRTLEAVAAELANTHAQMAQVAQAQLRATLDLARTRLLNSEHLAELTTTVQTEPAPMNMLIQILRVGRETQLFEQRQMIMVLEGALQSPFTEPTHLIENAFAAPKPVFPKPVFMLLAGIVSGLLIGMLWILWSDRWQRARSAGLGQEL